MEYRQKTVFRFPETNDCEEPSVKFRIEFPGSR